EHGSVPLFFCAQKASGKSCQFKPWERQPRAGLSVQVTRGTGRHMPNETTIEYRRRAEECRHHAKATNDALLKAHWLEQADRWKELADTAERVASLASIKRRRRGDT